MKTKIPGLLAVSLALAIVSATQAAELANESSIDAWLEDQIQNGSIPGIVALVADEDDVLFTGAYGDRNVARGLPMTDGTIFRIASMTKPVAATAIMMLVEEGKLSLDDEIGEYLEDYADLEVLERFDASDGSYGSRPAQSPVTLRQLLSHSSGLAYSFASDEIAALNARGINGPDVPLLYEPGSGWSYAMGISLVGQVLEEIEGVGLDEFLQERLFAPLGMNDTFYAVPAGKAGRVTTTHSRGEGGAMSESANPAQLRSGVSGDGGLFSTAPDYARFIQLILNDGVTANGQRLLSPASIAELSRNQLGNVRVSLQDEPLPNLARAFPLGAGRDGFGLGFQVTGEHDAADMRAPGSLSWAGIYNTEFWIDPENGIGGVLLMQFLPFYDPEAIEVLQEFERRVYAGLR